MLQKAAWLVEVVEAISSDDGDRLKTLMIEGDTPSLLETIVQKSAKTTKIAGRMLYFGDDDGGKGCPIQKKLQKYELGDTALHLAAKNEKERCCRALLQLGADRQVLNRVGKSPQDIAVGECIRLFQAADMPPPPLPPPEIDDQEQYTYGKSQQVNIVDSRASLVTEPDEDDSYLHQDTDLHVHAELQAAPPEWISARFADLESRIEQQHSELCVWMEAKAKEQDRKLEQIFNLLQHHSAIEGIAALPQPQLTEQLTAIEQQLEIQNHQRLTASTLIHSINDTLQEHRSATEEQLEVQQKALALQLQLLSDIRKNIAST